MIRPVKLRHPQVEWKLLRVNRLFPFPSVVQIVDEFILMAEAGNQSTILRGNIGPTSSGNDLYYAGHSFGCGGNTRVIRIGL